MLQIVNYLLLKKYAPYDIMLSMIIVERRYTPEAGRPKLVLRGGK